jgi:2,5-diketo-D-gluconate reductase A
MDRKSRINLASGRDMPIIGLGTRQLANDTAECIRAAVEAGYRLIDTAPDYGSTAGIGEGLRGASVPREEIFIVTHIGETDAPLDALVREVSEMGTRYVDLVLIRPPSAGGAGEHLWDSLIPARSKGLLRDIGVSHYPVALVERLAAAVGEMPAVNQVEWTPFRHDEALHAHHREAGIRLMACSPLGRGERLEEAALIDIARRCHRTPAQVLIRWAIQKGAVPVPKANRPDHARENLDVFDFEIGPQDMARLDGLAAEPSAESASPSRAGRDGS